MGTNNTGTVIDGIPIIGTASSNKQYPMQATVESFTPTISNEKSDKLSNSGLGIIDANNDSHTVVTIDPVSINPMQVNPFKTIPVSFESPIKGATKGLSLAYELFLQEPSICPAIETPLSLNHFGFHQNLFSSPTPVFTLVIALISFPSIAFL